MGMLRQVTQEDPFLRRGAGDVEDDPALLVVISGIGVMADSDRGRRLKPCGLDNDPA